MRKPSCPAVQDAAAVEVELSLDIYEEVLRYLEIEDSVRLLESVVAACCQACAFPIPNSMPTFSETRGHGSDRAKKPRLQDHEVV